MKIVPFQRSISHGDVEGLDGPQRGIDGRTAFAVGSQGRQVYLELAGWLQSNCEIGILALNFVVFFIKVINDLNLQKKKKLKNCLDQNFKQFCTFESSPGMRRGA